MDNCNNKKYDRMIMLNYKQHTVLKLLPCNFKCNTSFIPTRAFTLTSLVKKAINLFFLFAHSLFFCPSWAACWKYAQNTHAHFLWMQLYETGSAP